MVVLYVYYLLLLLSSTAVGLKWRSTTRRSSCGHSTALRADADAGADVDEYRNVITSVAGRFLPSSNSGAGAGASAGASAQSTSLLSSINWDAPKRKRSSLQKLAVDLDASLSSREWFVTGNVDPSFFDPAFSFQDPDVKLTGIRKYGEGVNKLFDQKSTRGEIISCVVNDTIADTITVTWRLEGRVNVGPGLPIKAFIVFSDLRVNPATGLVVFQEDRFSLPGWDIVLSAAFPNLPFLAKPAPPVVRPKTSPSSRGKGKGRELGGDVSTQLLFALTESFGRLLKPFSSASDSASMMSAADDKTTSSRRLSTKEMTEVLRREYENLWWITGTMDLSLWEENCVFADPFSSFGGSGSTLRFQKNAKALGSLIRNPKVRITSVEGSEEDNIVRIGWSFSSKLALPWRPVLAAAGETSHVLSPETGKITRYEERWKSKPWDVVKRLLVPTSEEE